jgi:hypothetical protein
VTYTCTAEDKEASEVLEILVKSEDGDKDEHDDYSTGTQMMPLLFTSNQLNDTNLPFMQTFVVNIFILY